MFYLLWKPENISSFNFINQYKRENSINRIGHSGTLDPLASGLMMVATNETTKLLQFVVSAKKTYLVNILFGKETSTLDLGSEVIKEDTKEISLTQFTDVLNTFPKSYWQLPPQFSAKKINGKRAYKYALEGKTVEIKKSFVHIYELSDIKELDKNLFQFKVHVSKGTYIRSLVMDIAEKLNTIAVMAKLVRTGINDFTEKDLGELNTTDIISFNKLDIINLDDLRNGKKITFDVTDDSYSCYFKNVFIGVLKIENNSIVSRSLLIDTTDKLLK